MTYLYSADAQKSYSVPEACTISGQIQRASKYRKLVGQNGVDGDCELEYGGNGLGYGEKEDGEIWVLGFSTLAENQKRQIASTLVALASFCWH